MLRATVGHGAAGGARRAAGDGGAVTFGSFNIGIKITPEVLRLWRRVLDAVPGSRLVVKSNTFAQPEALELFRERAVAAGLDASRLEVRGRTASMEAHLEAYGAIDVALDTFPYHGTTTTCEAMLMGVPVVTLTRDTHAGRVGASLLTAAGAGESRGAAWSPADWVARDAEEYVAIAAQLAGNLRQLESIRAGLRERLLSSPLCDGRVFAAQFQDAVREAWSGTAAKEAVGGR
ncbi:MAG: hypothetical protein QM783_02390 [Phycisphaerales bacterium]